MSPADKVLGKLLERIRTKKKTDVAGAAAFLLHHEWQEVQDRHRVFAELREVLKHKKLDFQAVVHWARKKDNAFTSGAYFGIHVGIFLASRRAEPLIASLVSEAHGPAEDATIARFITRATKIGFHAPDGAPAKSEAASFASLLLTAKYPDHFVDFKWQKWKQFGEWFKLNDDSDDDYPSRMRMVARWAARIAETPTFREHFASAFPEHPHWTVAGLAHLLTANPELKSIMKKINGPKVSDPPPPPPPGLRDLVLARKNVVLYGPPGTGKTYQSLALAEHWRKESGEDSVDHVTFHPSYAYEDFIEGFRPVEDGKFALRNGLFVEVCKKAEEDRKRPYLLVIDEINRGDVARIFGELITLIEADKRSEEAARKLPYSHQPFWVPPNLHLLGTMNTADRSISLMDIAIRRRFCFVECRPDPEVLSKSKVPLVEGIPLAGLLRGINARLLEAGIDRDRAIGHSYFLINAKDGEKLETLRQRLRYDILPLIEEYCYADRAVMGQILNGLVDENGEVDEKVLNDDDELVKVLKALAKD